MTPRVSAFLIVKNEAKRLPACLASLEGVADEIVVLDSDSTDDTLEIARAAGARVASRPFDGFGAQKQAALELCRGEWVLSIDADERLTPALASEIRALLDGKPAAVGYEVRRELHYLGHRLRFGGTGSDWVLRLARRERPASPARPYTSGSRSTVLRRAFARRCPTTSTSGSPSTWPR
ncbi:MAG: glycosyltransferase family 2 protein [Gemmatimonadales bacterium]